MYDNISHLASVDLMEEKQWVFNDISLGNPSTHHFSFSQYNINLYTSDSIFTSTNNVIRYHPIRKKHKNISDVKEITKNKLFLLTSCKSVKSLL